MVSRRDSVETNQRARVHGFLLRMMMMSLNVVDEREKDEQGDGEQNEPDGENVLVRCLQVLRKDEFARFEQPEENWR